MEHLGSIWLVSCDRKALHYSNHFPRINFSIALHSLYRKNVSAELIVLQGAPPRGDDFTSLSQVLQALYSKRQKQPLLP